MPRSASLGLGLALLALAGCTDAAPDDLPSATSGAVRMEIPLFSAQEIDLLFVVDSSPGIAAQRARLLEGYRRVIEALEAFPGGAPDLHIGVVTSDVGTRGAYTPDPAPALGTGPGSCTSEGDRGELRRSPGIMIGRAPSPAGSPGYAPGGNFLADIARPDGTRERNYTGSLADAFVRLADAGAAGCTYPRPLEAMRRALVGNPANDGFRRERAVLAVVLLSGDDDCSFGSTSFVGGELDRARCTANAGSLLAIEDHVASLRSVTEPDRLVVLGAFSPPDAPCADAGPAPRLAAFVGSFPNRSHAVSLCAPDLGDLMTPIAQLQRRSLASPCFDGPLLDTDPIAPGLQPECAAWYSYLDGGARVEEGLPPCRDGGPASCWRLERAPQICDGERVDLRGPRRGFGAQAEARAIIECASR